MKNKCCFCGEEATTQVYSYFPCCLTCKDKTLERERQKKAENKKLKERGNEK